MIGMKQDTYATSTRLQIKCPWWVSHLIYNPKTRFIDKELNFGDAIKHCRDIRDNRFPRSYYYEDMSAMLTVQDLHNMLR